MFAFPGKREIVSLIFTFARGFTWFASSSLIYCVLLNAIVEKTRNLQLLDLAFKKRPTVYIQHMSKPRCRRIPSQ